MGVYGGYNDVGNYLRYGGMFRDNSDGYFKFFEELLSKPSSSVNTSHSSYLTAPIWAKDIKIGNTTSFATIN